MAASVPSGLPQPPGSVAIFAPMAHLPLRLRLATPLDDHELYEFCRIHRDLRIERTADGELVIMPPTGAETGRRNLELLVQLGTWSKRDGRGVAFDSSTGFVLPNGAERSPDGAWVRKDRWEALTSDERRKFAPLCPDFVVELCSPSDDRIELGAKLEEYIGCGAQLGWLIDPERRRVEVYRSGRPPETLHDPATVRADPELPGFELDMASIW